MDGVLDSFQGIKYPNRLKKLCSVMLSASYNTAPAADDQQVSVCV